MNYLRIYFDEVSRIAESIDLEGVERLVKALVDLRERQGGYTKEVGDEVIVVPTVDPARVTPHTEAFQAVVWHCLVSYPALCRVEPKWEGLDWGQK